MLECPIILNESFKSYGKIIAVNLAPLLERGYVLIILKIEGGRTICPKEGPGKCQVAPK